LFPISEVFIDRQTIEDAIRNGKCLLLQAINFKNNALQSLQSIGGKLKADFQE